ncbi:TolB family protein [Nonomuraea antri]|uniref:TolB family protein n=1 Tax=Nonomuraea antri TaxID=2730852 RepID=UPI001568326F|nr:hypothetical protein [Nonomuraea antri]
MRRLLVLLTSVLVLAGAATAYAAWAASDRRAAPAAAAFDAAAPGRVLVRSGGRIAAVPTANPGAAPQVSGRACDRFSTANGTTLCLITRPGTPPTTQAIILDRSLRPVRTINLAGIPSRARVSPSGRMASWTVFVTGDSYNSGGFSTWTGILDTRTGYLITNMEDIPLYLDGRRHHSVDVNYWGVTFAADDDRFYATVSTKGKTYLVEGDFGDWRARALRENAECPSLSPDGTRLVFKKRVSPGPWRLHVLDLATMRERALGETASVDDQAAWLDPGTVMYAKDGDVWAAPLDGGPPRLLIPDATSPTAIP